MYILKLKSSKFYVKIIGSMQILGTTPLNLQENIKAFKEIEIRKGKQMKTLTIKCDRLLEIDAQKSQVIFEVENIDLSFLKNLTALEVAKNCDIEHVLDYFDYEYFQDYIAERFNIIL